MPRIPEVEAPSAFMMPMSRVFSTTIIEKIARMPNPATAMMKNSRMFRMLCSIGHGAQQRALLLLPGRDPEEHRPQLVEGGLDPLGAARRGRRRA